MFVILVAILYIWCMKSIIILFIVHVIFHSVFHSLGYTVVIGHAELNKYGPSAFFFRPRVCMKR